MSQDALAAGAAVGGTRTIGEFRFAGDGRRLPRRDAFEYKETSKLSSPPSDQPLGNVRLGQLKTRGLEKLHHLVIYSRGFAPRPLGCKNRGGKARHAELCQKNAELLVSTTCASGHWRSSKEANRRAHSAVDAFVDNGCDGDELSIVEEDEYINQRVARDEEGNFVYRDWESGEGNGG